MRIENTEIFNFQGAIRGMRNPLNSWDMSDSFICDDNTDGERCKTCRFCRDVGECEKAPFNSFFVLGLKDLILARKLVKAGSEHRKFMRQIMISVDITAPLYWWKEFDTYKVGTAANSTSTMHKLASTPITMDCFEMEDFEDISIDVNTLWDIPCSFEWESLINYCEALRQKYNETKDKRYWKELIRLLPESWLQTRTVTMNYENALNIYRQRQNHKLSEWHTFTDWAETLPYFRELVK